MRSEAASVDDYLAALSQERREALKGVRKAICGSLPEGYEESMQFGMPSYVVPLSRFPKTYNGAPLMYAAFAAQKNYISIYLTNVYSDEETRRWFQDACARRGIAPDMGKSCLRFRRPHDIPLDLIGAAVARTPVDAFIPLYDAARRGARSRSDSVRR